MTTLNLTGELERLIRDITARTPQLQHVIPDKLLVCVSTGRTTRGGSLAKIHPLRFAGGERSVKARRGRRSVLCTMPSIKHQGEEMLYVIYFLVPRFLELPQREKLITIFHELYHISPACDGDIRRFPGRNYAHGSSTKSYNLLMGKLVDAYLKLIPEPSALDFLEGDLASLRTRHKAIVGRRLQAPRISITPA
ncbi:putative metallopeptidase [Citrifermentans bremense]|uniref:putative metallopeptidase n=1 Tax=Citrifermentans bremense TaxID=60035 RepID=UPI0004261458|nr:putative metallopeptidase [Citrifermentans bremense]